MAMAQELEKAEEQQQVAQHMEDDEDEDELGDEAFEGVELGDDEEAIEDGDGEEEEKPEGEDGDGYGEEKVADGDAAADLKKSDAAEAAEEAKLFIGGITRNTTTEMLTNHFKKYGELTDSVIMKERDSGRPRGFGFVTYADSSVLDKVLQETHVIDGKSVDVKRTVPRDKITPGPKTKKIFVGGLLPSTTAGDLKDYFSKFGKVEEHQIMHYHSSGKSRGFGFVTFESEQSVEDVILNGKMHEIGGKQVEIKKAEPKKTAQDSGPIRGPLLKGQGGPRRGGYGAGMSRGGGGGGPLRGGRDGGRPVSYGGFDGYGGGMHGYGAGGYRGGSYGGTGPMTPIGYGGGYGMGGGGYGDFGGYGAMGYGGYAAAGGYGGGGSGYGAGNVGGGGRRNAGNGRYNPYGR